jgi:hypothetical protein
MSFLSHWIVVLSTYCLNQIIWLSIAWSSVFTFVAISGYNLLAWGSQHPGYIIFWNFFNDFIPFLITLYRKNFHSTVTLNSLMLVIFLIGYGVSGLYIAWWASGNPYLAGLNYSMLTLMVFGARFLMLWNLNIQYKNFKEEHHLVNV